MLWGKIMEEQGAGLRQRARRKGKLRLRGPIDSKESGVTYAFCVITGAGNGYDVNARVCLCVRGQFRSSEPRGMEIKDQGEKRITGERYESKRKEGLGCCTYIAGAPVDLKVFGQRQEHFRAADPHPRWGPWKIIFQIKLGRGVAESG